LTELGFKIAFAVIDMKDLEGKDDPNYVGWWLRIARTENLE
jgi:hypothetical protein